MGSERGVWSMREEDLDLRVGGNIPGEKGPEQALDYSRVLALEKNAGRERRVWSREGKRKGGGIF